MCVELYDDIRPYQGFYLKWELFVKCTARKYFMAQYVRCIN